jgi:hypothetical protein
MRVRSVVVVGLLAVSAVTAVPSAQAARPSPRPVVVIGAVQGPQQGPEGGQEWVLPIDAVDPDGVIMEVAVRWDGGMVWASTACLQGPEPGTPAHLLIGFPFDPGRNRVQVEATSLQHCPFTAPGGLEQHSRRVTKIVTVPG